jgi:hypothetical protein
MTSPPVRTRSFVMVLLGWCAFSSAPVVALSPPLAAAFFVLAIGLVAVSTLRFSLLTGGVVAIVAAFLFAVVLAAGPVPVSTLGPEQIGRVLSALVRSQTLLPALLGAASLAGAAVFGDLAAAGLEWDLFARSTAPAASRPDRDTEPVPDPAPPVPNGRAPEQTRTRRTIRRGDPPMEEEETDR